MGLPAKRTRIAGILSLCLLALSAPGAMASGPRPDAEIRLGTGSNVGGDAYSPVDQAVTGSGAIGDKLTFWITIGNDGYPAESFKVKRSGKSRDGFRVRYFASGTDVTGKVNKGTFTTPTLANGQTFVMRATVKIHDGVSLGSSVSRMITVSSTLYPSIKDAVRFTAIAPGPAVRFSVTGLVEQPSVCVAGPECVGFPAADYPRQVAKITALDAWGNIATGYAGTVSFVHPTLHYAPGGMPDMTLSKGVAYVPVLVPDLLFGYFEEPFDTHCPSGVTGNGVVLTATDTLDPSIFGCQNIPGGTLSILFPNGFAETTTTACPSGCFADPTDSIVIDPTFVIPGIITPNVTSGGSATAFVGTSTDHFASVPITVGSWYVGGDGVPVGTLSKCSTCSTNLNYFVPSIDTASAGSLQMTATQITVEGRALEINNYSDFWIDAGTMSFKTVVTNGSTPTCYLDSQGATVVSLSECGEDPF